MKYKITENGLEIRLGWIDRGIKKILELVFKEKQKEYVISYELLDLLYEEDSSVLEKIGIMLDYENLKLDFFSIVEINLKNLKFYYGEKELKLLGRFLVSKDKKLLLFLNKEFYQLIKTISRPHLKPSQKLSQVFLLKDKYDFKIFLNKEVEFIKDYQLKVMPKDGSIYIDYIFYGIPNKRVLVKSGSYSGKRKTYFLKEDIRNDLLTLEKYRDKTTRQIKIDQSNIEEFYKDYLENFSEDIVEKLSDRVKFLTFEKRKIPLVSRKGDLSGIIDYKIINFHDLVSGGTHDLEITEELRDLIDKAKREGRKFVFYKDSWIMVENIDHLRAYLEDVEKLESEKEQDVGTKVKLDIVIKENIDELEYSKVYSETREKLDRKLNLKYFVGKLKAFQETGVKKIINAYLEGFKGFLLADDMGLGKTAQSIAFMTWLYENKNLFPVLIVSPVTLKENWRNEIKRFSPELYRYIDKDIIITNYEVILNNPLILEKDWKLVITDEAQRYKNVNSKTSRFIKSLKSEFNLALTGTPVENRIEELWNIYDFAVPGLLGKLKDFRKEYGVINEAPSSFEAEKKSAKIMQIIDPVFLRRNKSDSEVEIAFPPKKEDYVKVYLTDLQQDIYFDTYMKFKSRSGRKFLALAIKLLQVCDFPYEKFGDSDYYRYSGKLLNLGELISKIINKNEKALIFTKFIITQQIIKDFLEKFLKVKCEILNGEVSIEKREQIIKNFKNNNTQILIINPRVGGVGLNLIEANHVIHYTPEWNPAITSQATDRVYRIGQEKEVFVYHFYSVFRESNMKHKGTIEEYFMRLLEKKKGIRSTLLENVLIREYMKEIEKDLCS
ncbi:DEAD/DEAH box helicase [Thermosipho sp. 1244]|uniref:DEAD/DEAH box helicase n=1 Tax=Thermosipho sp. 1244 TaxID=1755816 RepID=UPI001BDEE3E5|nr:DEAD/DEAH box helicase [Thermosipho sp. 1244]MBT1248689.1 helicase [Thermosipho sp. 1244]